MTYAPVCNRCGLPTFLSGTSSYSGPLCGCLSGDVPEPTKKKLELSDGELLEILKQCELEPLKKCDTETKRLPQGFKIYARAVIAADRKLRGM